MKNKKNLKPVFADWKRKIYFVLIVMPVLILSCKNNHNEKTRLSYTDYTPKSSDTIISREKYLDKLYGFWLGQCIGNWTGLVTEMDKIGNIGKIKTGAFYTREDWGKPDQPNIWAQGVQGHLSPTIDFVLRDESEVWGADDDTDIEYMYQYLCS